jgi:hypothetical protein
MTNQLSTKLSALGLALLVNIMMLSGVAYLFNPAHAAAGTPALALSASSTQRHRQRVENGP